MSASRPSPSSPAEPQDTTLKWWILLSVSMGVFLSTIDGSIVNVALPTLEDELNTDFKTVQWIAVAYLLVVTALVLSVGRLADMIGKKRIYQSGMAIFTMGSLLCGIAPSVGFLIGFRVIQALGAVAMQALGIAIITEAFPASERGRALGIIGTVVSVGISLGPTLGGILIDTVSWHAIFLVNLPVGVVGLILVHRFVPDWRPPGGQRFDPYGALIVLLSLVALALGLTFAPETGWGDPRIIGLLLGAGVGLVVLVLVEQRMRQPMIDLSLFKDTLFSVSLLTGFMLFVVVAGLFVLTFYLDYVKGFSPREYGLFLTVVPAALGLTAPVAGWLSDRYGSRGISLLGLIVLVGGCLAIATLKEGTSTPGYIVRLLPLGFGAGLFQSPNNSAIMGAAPRERLGVASGLLALSRTLGQTTGIPLMGAIFASRVFAVAEMPNGSDVVDAPNWAIVEGVETAFLAAAGLMFMGVLLAGYAFIEERQRRRSQRIHTRETAA